jgi:ComF family protein
LVNYYTILYLSVNQNVWTYNLGFTIRGKKAKICFMITDYLRAAKNILFPPLCFYCGKKIKEEFLCSQCFQNIEFMHPPLCRFCSRPIEDNKTGLCKRCLYKKPSYDRVISVTFYKEPIITLIHLFKYKNYDYLEKFFSSLMAEHLLKIGFNFSEYDFITSVPIHPLRAKERGYNQSALLAHCLASRFRVRFRNDIIHQTIYKPSQTKLRQPQREKNIRDAFRVEKNVERKKIILIDDIFTTGSTVESCSLELKEKGVKTVTVITLSSTSLSNF